MPEVAEALPPVEESTPAGAEQAQQEQPAEAVEKPPELTPEQIRIKELEQREKRLQRGIDRKTRQLAEARAQHLTRPAIVDNNADNADDSQPLSVTRAELAKYVKAEAEKLAPTLAEQRAEATRRQGVIDSLAKTWGQEKFDEVASDLDEAFGGLQDTRGSPKPAIEAVFEADDPVAVIEWLANPENSDEAERISRLSAVQAGKAIAKLELKIAAETEKAKPKVSKAPAPLEPVKGPARINGMPDPKNTREWMAWRNDQERKGLA